jgi:hypothetical protein
LALAALRMPSLARSRWPLPISHRGDSGTSHHRPSRAGGRLGHIFLKPHQAGGGMPLSAGSASLCNIIW